MKVIHDVVAAAAGFNASRGDQLTVETLPFEATLKSEPPPVPSSGQQSAAGETKATYPTALPGRQARESCCCFWWFGFLQIRSHGRAKAKLMALQKQLAAGSAGSDGRGSGEQLSMDSESSRSACEDAPKRAKRQRKLAEVRESFHLPPVLTSKTEILTKQLTEEAQKDPVALAQIIRSWLNEGTPNH